MSSRIGKTETGKLFHIINVMDGSDRFALCGCYMPPDMRIENTSAFELDKEGLMCERCMYSRYYKQSRD